MLSFKNFLWKILFLVVGVCLHYICEYSWSISCWIKRKTISLCTALTTKAMFFSTYIKSAPRRGKLGYVCGIDINLGIEIFVIPYTCYSL